MKTFQVVWESPGNIEKGTVIVRAANIVQAQDKFLAWLKGRPVYEHMWSLLFTFKEVEESEVIE